MMASLSSMLGLVIAVSSSAALLIWYTAWTQSQDETVSAGYSMVKRPKVYYRILRVGAY